MPPAAGRCSGGLRLGRRCRDTPLHLAAWKGHTHAAAALLANGASERVTNDQGCAVRLPKARATTGHVANQERVRMYAMGVRV